jgi:hypothetical protein
MSIATELADSSFRFLSLTRLQAITIEREVPGATQQKHWQNDCYVGYVALSHDNLQDIANFFVRQQIKVEECDLFIAITSPLQTNTVAAPDLVNQMLKFIDCKLTFSYTVC